MRVNKVFLGCISFALTLISPVRAQVWQWSAPVQRVVSSETNAHPQAFLWIPENCRYVRGVVVGQHNMLEEGIFEHPAFRKTITKLGFALVWVTPAFNITFDFTNSAGADFNEMMRRLAEVSGYRELAIAPVVPIGHSALASYPWNFAAWNPGRTSQSSLFTAMPRSRTSPAVVGQTLIGTVRRTAICRPAVIPSTACRA